MGRPFQPPKKVHLATLREFPPGKSGKPYFKGRFGDAIVFLFREDTPYRMQNGHAYYDWNLVVANDHNAIRAYQDTGPHHEDGTDPVSDADKAARDRQGTQAGRARKRRADRGQ